MLLSTRQLCVYCVLIRALEGYAPYNQGPRVLRPPEHHAGHSIRTKKTPSKMKVYCVVVVARADRALAASRMLRFP